MKTTIRELKALAKRAGVVMRYSKLHVWVLDLPEDTWYVFNSKDELKKKMARYILLGIIAEREGLIDKPGYKDIVVEGGESTWHAGEHEL